MAGAVPAIHVLWLAERRTWMPGTSPGMTTSLRALHRGLFGRPLRIAEIVRRVDQRDVSQRLREIAGLAARAGIIFLRQQPDIVCDSDDAIKQRLRLVEFPGQRISVG